MAGKRVCAFLIIIASVVPVSIYCLMNRLIRDSHLFVVAVSHSTPNNSSPSSGTALTNHVTTPSAQVNGALGNFF